MTTARVMERITKQEDFERKLLNKPLYYADAIRRADEAWSRYNATIDQWECVPTEENRDNMMIAGSEWIDANDAMERAAHRYHNTKEEN